MMMVVVDVVMVIMMDVDDVNVNRVQSSIRACLVTSTTFIASAMERKLFIKAHMCG